MVIEKPGMGKVAIAECDVLWVTRAIVDAANFDQRKAGVDSGTLQNVSAAMPLVPLSSVS